MSEKLHQRTVPILATLALFAAMLPLSVSSAQTPTPGGSATAPLCRMFSETGKTVCDSFLSYWLNRGGLAQQGYPISERMQEASEVDGKTYTVQYFERSIMEAHPEYQAPNDVLLTLLGALRYTQKYPNGAAEISGNNMPGNSVTFPQTGQIVRGVFLTYWQQHGGLAQQGYPISNLVQEKSDLDGKTYIMQYFERAVFEYHPENAAPNNVLLSQLGTLKYTQRYGGNPPSGLGSTLAVGTWGSKDISLTITADGAHFEFSCAHATITGTVPINNGNIDVMGTYYQESGGPTRTGDEQGQPAHFTGTVSGNTLILTITVAGIAQPLGPFTFTFGQQARVVKCL